MLGFLGDNMATVNIPDYRFRIPETGDWECALFGGHFGRDLVYIPTKGGESNRFWRLMQFLAFGNRWRKKSNNPIEPTAKDRS